MSNDSDKQRSERLTRSREQVANARKIAKKSCVLREASERLLAAKRRPP
jgi:hypothetical protein